MAPTEVVRHPFLPLLGYQKVLRKMDFEAIPPMPIKKPRDIRYASHTDSAIFSQYAHQLGPHYDNFLVSNGLNEAVLAYRGGIGYNVPFAKSLFNEITGNGDCHVICLDISGFFDNISHTILKQKWCRIMGVERLPHDWFKIFTRLTRYEFVIREELEGRIGKSKGTRLCQIDTFRRLVRPLIHLNDRDSGIPQGTPLSGLLANLYLMDFDLIVSSFVRDIGGSYRRYSDDIAIVLPRSMDVHSAMVVVNQSLMYHGLCINDKKTKQSEFSRRRDGIRCGGDLLQYLGFTFDGKQILVRSESMKNFYAKMKRALSRYIWSAARKGIPSGQLRRRVLVGKYTHWGERRNFVQYAYRASREMEAPEIKRQLRNHVKIFDLYRKEMVAKWYGRYPQGDVTSPHAPV